MKARSVPNWIKLGAVAIAAAATGCASRPDQANILLRKQNQDLQAQITDLQTQNAGLKAQLQAETQNTIPQLPQSRLDELFTTCGLKLGNMTGGYTPSDSGPDTMLKVYVVPTDQQGQPLKAAGSFKIELFDLAEPDTRLGTWDFPVDMAKNDWFGQAFLYTYEFDCPWQKPPRHANLTLEVTFTDALTGRVFTTTSNLTVSPPG